ncbi:MAG: PDZ domain-containing protein [Bacillota bacterium]
MYKFKKTAVVILTIAALLALSLIIRTQFVLIKPGSAQELRSLVMVEGADPDDSGNFYLVTVAQQRANLFSLIYGYLHPHVAIQRLTDVIPQGMSQQDYRQLLNQWMRESQLLAQIIALRRMGYEVEIPSQGTVIVGFLDDSPSQEILRQGDVIIAVDGTAVSMANEVISAVQNRAVGAAVTLTVIREEQEYELKVITAPHPGNPDQPALGVYIRTLHGDPVLPIEVRMETGEIGGPSAGMMFVLEILNQLTPGDITGGQLIAGTGTIDINENVGRIGGVFQKVIAAENSGAQYFIVPESNYDEARKAAHRIELVPVSTLQDVLEFLDTLSFSSEQKTEGELFSAAEQLAVIQAAY